MELLLVSNYVINKCLDIKTIYLERNAINMDKLCEFTFDDNDYYIIQLMIDKDVDNLQELCEACSDYHELAEGQPTSKTAGREIFLDAPKGKNPEDKMILGVYVQKAECKELIGVIDSLNDFPESGTWFVGLMMLIPSHRKYGIGEKVYKEYIKWANQNGAKKIRIGVLQENDNALKFWKRMGFKVVKKIDNYQSGNKITVVFAMEHKLTKCEQ